MEPQAMIIVTLIGGADGVIRVCTNQQNREALACFLIDTCEYILRGIGEEGNGSQETVSPTSEDPSGRTAEVGAGEGDANKGRGDSDS